MNPTKMSEILMRNKRDAVWQIGPKLAFDARQEYISAIEFYEKNFGS